MLDTVSVDVEWENFKLDGPLGGVGTKKGKYTSLTPEPHAWPAHGRCQGGKEVYKRKRRKKVSSPGMS